MFGRFFARQFSKPSRLIGPLVLAPLWNRRNRALNDSALDLLALEPNHNILEIGFGGGYLIGEALARVPCGSVAGIDASAAMTDSCRRAYRSDLLSGRLELKTGSAGAIPFADGRFDRVCSVNSLFYWTDVTQGLWEGRRVLRDGGVLVLVFTGSRSLRDRSFAQHGLTLLDGPEVGHLMTDVGFDVSRIEETSDRHRSYWCVVGTRRL